MEPLLTIAVPTYNRKIHLGYLLDALAVMSHDLAGTVEIIISDNASVDGTDAVLADFRVACPNAIVLRNETNIGADANVAQCFARARGVYVWIIGDDDIPKAGVLQGVLEVLRSANPDIVYLPSEWMTEVCDPNQGKIFDPGRYQVLDRLLFARHVNVWLTFLSGIVVRKAHASEADAATFQGSNIPQLGWVLPALRKGTVFCAFEDAGMLATAGNTGGYSAVRVFGVNLPAVVAQAFGVRSAEYAAIVGRTVAGYLPQLIWSMRTGQGGRLDPEMPWDLLREQIGGFSSFWCLALPVGRAPQPIARAALYLSGLVGRAGRLRDRFALRFSRSFF